MGTDMQSKCPVCEVEEQRGLVRPMGAEDWGLDCGICDKHFLELWLAISIEEDPNVQGTAMDDN